MTISAKTKIISIGNSRGIRIPKLLLDKAELEGEVELEIKDGHLVVSPARGVRFGWDKKFERMALQGDDRLLDSEAVITSSWDETEWEW